MNPLALMSLPYRLIAIAALVLGLLAAGGIALRHYGNTRYAAGEAAINARWDAEREKQQASALAESQSNAKETQRRLERQGDAQREYDAQLAQARAAAVTASAAVDGLRKRAAQYAAAARRAASNPASVGNGTATGDPGVLLADVPGQLAERARLLAAYADAARRAGKQCERDYDALSATIH